MAFQGGGEPEFDHGYLFGSNSLYHVQLYIYTIYTEDKWHQNSEIDASNIQHLFEQPTSQHQDLDQSSRHT